MSGAVGIIVCVRGVRRYCATPGHGDRVAPFLCDYPLQGEKAGQLCSRPMCLACSKRVSFGRDWCPPHVRMAEQLDSKG